MPPANLIDAPLVVRTLRPKPQLTGSGFAIHAPLTTHHVPLP